MKFNHIRSALNELINKNKDAYDGFHELAKAAEDEKTRALLEKYAADRADFVSVLEVELTRIGGQPTKKFNILDDLHRAWIDLKVNNSDNNLKAISEECVRGERIAIEDYEDIIEHIDMPHVTHKILLKQLEVIKERFVELENLHA